MKEFDVVIIEDKTGGYTRHVPSLPDCHTQGDAIEELVKNIRKAIELYLETLQKSSVTIFFGLSTV